MKTLCVGALCALIASSLALAQSDIDGSRRNAIVRSIEAAAPAVVSVNVIVRQNDAPVFRRDFWNLYYDPSYAQMDSVGSGFFFDDAGHILTNYHVIEDADYLRSVTLPDGREIKVEYVGGDQRTDIAVLKAKGSDLPQSALGSSADLMIGEWAIAIGNPFGGLIRDPHPSVSVGVVSATHRRVSREIGEGERLYQDLIQTDAAINPGNSGGPLVNAKGEVIGINTMIFTPSGGSVGLGFAIPIDRAKRVANEIIRYGRRRDPWAGFKVEAVQSVRPDFLRELNVQAKSGCLIVNILKSSPAYEAGLRPGDVIVAMNDVSVSHPSDIDFVIWGLFVDDTITVTADRQSNTIKAKFPVAELKQ